MPDDRLNSAPLRLAPALLTVVVPLVIAPGFVFVAPLVFLTWLANAAYTVAFVISGHRTAAQGALVGHAATAAAVMTLAAYATSEVAPFYLFLMTLLYLSPFIVSAALICWALSERLFFAYIAAAHAAVLAAYLMLVFPVTTLHDGLVPTIGLGLVHLAPFFVTGILFLHWRLSRDE